MRGDPMRKAILAFIAIAGLMALCLACGVGGYGGYRALSGILTRTPTPVPTPTPRPTPTQAPLLTRPLPSTPATGGGAFTPQDLEYATELLNRLGDVMHRIAALEELISRPASPNCWRNRTP